MLMTFNILTVSRIVIVSVSFPENGDEDSGILLVGKKKTARDADIINVFKGKIKDHKLYVGDEAILDTKAEDNDDVFVGIRPEGIIPGYNGRFTLNVERIQTQGKDTSLVCDHPSYSGEEACKFLVDSDQNVGLGKKHFIVRQNKVYVFDGKTEKRIAL